MFLIEDDYELFPFVWNGKTYHEEDCNDVFLCFYSSPFEMHADGAVSITGKDRVFPDGTFDIPD